MVLIGLIGTVAMIRDLCVAWSEPGFVLLAIFVLMMFWFIGGLTQTKSVHSLLQPTKER